jgi:hypothetical protein
LAAQAQAFHGPIATEAVLVLINIVGLATFAELRVGEAVTIIVQTITDLFHVRVDVRVVGATVGLIRIRVVVVVGITRITTEVIVAVLLRRIRRVRTIILSVQNAVTIGIS